MSKAATGLISGFNLDPLFRKVITIAWNDGEYLGFGILNNAERVVWFFMITSNEHCTRNLYELFEVPDDVDFLIKKILDKYSINVFRAHIEKVIEENEYSIMNDIMGSLLKNSKEPIYLCIVRSIDGPVDVGLALNDENRTRYPSIPAYSVDSYRKARKYMHKEIGN